MHVRGHAALLGCLACAAGGCLVTASTGATIAGAKNGKGYSVAAVVPAPPDQIYSVLDEALEQRRDVEFIERYPDGHRLEATRGDAHVNIEITDEREGRSELVVEAKSADDAEGSEALARLVVAQLCEGLALQCVFREGEDFERAATQP